MSADVETPRVVGLAWYAVACKPRQETIAEENLKRQGFQVYLPRLLTRQRRNGRWQECIQPLFPRYLFVLVDKLAKSVAPIRSTRGALGLVRFGSEPAIVPKEIIDSIRAGEDKELRLHLDPEHRFQAGEHVRFCEGPFAGLDGIFAANDGDQRAVILIELLGKMNQVRVSRDSIALAA